MRRRAAAAVLLLAASPLLSPPASAQETGADRPTPWLSRARVTATVPDSGSPVGPVRLEAAYRFRPGLDTARLSAIRVDDAAVELTAVADVPAETRGTSGDGWRLDTLPGLVRLLVPDPPDSLVLAWRVLDSRERIPLFLPETPTRPAESRVLIRVSGGEFDVAAGRVFPRMERADGRLVGRPENLPSFLLLPPAGRPFTVDRAADWSVVLLVLVATGWWAAWRRRAARRAGEAEGEPPAGSGRSGGAG